MSTVTLLPSAKLQFADASGVPMANGTITFYVPSTTTPKDTWQDINRTVLNQNPLTLDPSGRAIIFGDGSYRMVLKDAAGNTIWDQVTTTAVSSAMAPVTLAPDIATAQGLLGIDPTLPASLAAETAARIAADNAEATARAAADSSEAAARAAADTTLQTNINTETTARVAADAALQAEIDGLSAASGPTQNRHGTITTGLLGDFSISFSPAFPGGVLMFWLGLSSDIGLPQLDPLIFPQLTSITASAAVGTAVRNDHTPVGSTAMNWFALGFTFVLAVLNGF